MRAESPTINCSGKSNITLSFNYIESGEGSNDNATLWYYDGSAWLQLDDTPKTNNSGCGGQGRWDEYSINLPASANNNNNVKIGFNWTNNGNGVGTDPSFAVDNITLSADGTLPVTWLDFSGEIADDNNSVILKWSTASELDNDYFTIQKSKDGINFITIEKVKGAGNSSFVNEYFIYDRKPFSGISYYRIFQTDYDGAIDFHEKTVVINRISRNINIYPNPIDEAKFKIEVSSEKKSECEISVVNELGQSIFSDEYILKEGKNDVEIKLDKHLRKGVYFVLFDIDGYVTVEKLLVK